MARNNKLRIALYFVLFTLLCSYIFQLFYTNKIKETQQSSIQLQKILSLADDVSTNLGLTQQYFRANLLDSPSKKLIPLKNLQHKFDSTLTSKANLISSFPSIKFHLDSVAKLYQLESDITYSLITAPDLSTPLTIIAKSEKRMTSLWKHIRISKEKTQELINQNHELIIKHINTTQTIRIFSLFLVVVLVILVYAFYNNSRKAAYKASYSSKSILTNQLLLMKSLLDATSTLMYIIDGNGRYLFANKSFLDFFGLKESDVIGRTYFELEIKKSIRFENISIITDPTNTYIEKEEVAYEEDNKVYFFTRKFPIKNNKNEVFASGVVFRNITERILNEDGLKKSRHDAEQAKLTQEQFMANISHEIRTPMNGIMGMAHLLSNTSLNEEQTDYLQTIQQSSENLMVLINDILDFSKIEAGKLELEHISFKISDVLDQLTFPLKAKAQEKNLSLNISINHKVPLKVLGDPLRLNQIITNILSNAIKFTFKGGININVSAECYNSPQIKIIFKIEDTGIGIPEDRINYIFQSFTQTSLDVTRKFGGTGLGLAIVKQLVELHNGIITVESRENKGSIFTIEIPYKPVVTGKRLDSENLKFDLLKGKRVLVVEDNFINQKVILQTLKNAGIEAYLADNGYKALDILKEQEFDLIIMDIQMPEIDGCETTIIIRNELSSTIPIIAMTASAMQEDRDKCKAAGMNEYISKPFITEDLLEKMLLFI